MSLQNSTIQRYRLFYPQETLREISARTGIQITRVFRLVNGKPMRLKEFEAFEKAIQIKIAENPNQSRLNKNLEEASSILSHEELGRIADYIERKVNNRKFTRNLLSPIFEEAVIA
jgi:hypothetical protein